MTSQSSNNKNELLAEIVKLETILAEQREQYKAEKEARDNAEKQKNNLEKIYREIKQQFDDACVEYNQKRYIVDDLTRFGKDNQEKLDKLKRELSRLTDRERLELEYLEKVEEFRNRCLDSLWRAENRDDGRGAFPHQLDGAIHLAITKQVLLGDKRGLGKSLTSLIACDLVEAKKVIAVCPPDLVDNFIREVKMWTPHRSPIKLSKMTRDQRDFLLTHLKTLPQFFLVTNYESWRKDSKLVEDLIALKADTLIADEVHRGKTLGTVTCQGLHKLRFGHNNCPSCRSTSNLVKTICISKSDELYKCGACGHEGFTTDFSSFENVFPMTGTPILNKPQELYPTLRLIDPRNFKSENNFLRDFCWMNSQRKWTWNHRGETALVKKIGPRFLARDRKSAGIIIPPPTPQDHIITVEEMEENYPKQLKAYRQVRDYAQLVLDPDNQVTMSMPAKIVALLRLRQVLTWPAAIELKWTNPDTKLEEVVARLDVYESAKLDKAEELTKEIVEEGERVVIFSKFKKGMHVLKDRLLDAGIRAVTYDGDTSADQRNRIQLDFDPKTVGDKPQYDVVLCNYGAAGEGLNLHSASQMILLDREWNPGKEAQAVGRIDRLGQTRDTTIHTIKVEQSVDTWMDKLISDKRDLIEGFEGEADIYRSAYDALRNGEM